MMDDFAYAGKDMTNNQGPKVALLDSSNITIQLPQTVFENTLREMQRNNANGLSFYEARNPDSSITIEANKPCSQIYNVLSPISFKLQSTTISIAPRGLTLKSDPNSEDEKCRIALEKLVGVSNEYRLGNVFLRNFYTALDFDNDLIIIGVNKGMNSVAMASIEGRVYNPFKPRYTVFKVVLIFFFLAIVAGGIAYYNHRRKEFEEEVKARNARIYGN